MMSKENSYFLDAESSEEMVRLLEQDGVFTEGMGGLWAERQNDFRDVKSVLDIGCGPGGWVQDICRGHPAILATGVDISQRMIEYASAQAEMQGLDNASFQIMDATKALTFADESFDLINVRFLLGFLHKDLWPVLLREFWRLLRPGGSVRLTESEFLGVSNSQGMEILAGYLAEAFKRAGHSTSPESRGTGVLPKMASLLRNTGFSQVRIMAHMLEYSYGTPAYEAMIEDWSIAYRLNHPFLLQFQVTDQQELDRRYEQMMNDFKSPDFCALVDLVTVYGVKPQ